MNFIGRPRLSGLACLALAMLVSGAGPRETGAAPREAEPIMPLDEVRIGMKGYGLSVFHGTSVEPFEVEVVSIQRDFAPGRGVIWLRCPGERMQKTGPVSGMSGSPIFLWEEGESGVAGHGGRLIGAFAYGYSMSEDCYVGVQPIKAMRRAAGRMKRGAEAEAAAAGRQTAPLAADDPLANLIEQASRQNRQLLGRARLLAELAGAWRGAETREPSAESPGAPAARRAPALAGHPDGSVRPMRLPVTLPDARLAELVEPAFGALGLRALSGPSLGAMAPPGIDLENVRFEPGSVLSIPLAFGDMNLAASGTVTEVLPNGQVLGFGHAMFGTGDVALPMATGWVHLVLPSIVNSFKLSGPGPIRGALARDEQAAVVGGPEATFTTAPVKVTTRLPGQPEHAYAYEVVHHPELTASLAAILVTRSLIAEQSLPPENTLRLTGRLDFEQGQSIEIDTLLANSSIRAIFSEVAVPITLLQQNPHEALDLTSARFEIEVEPAPRLATLVNARLERPVVRPGETIVVHARLRAFRGELIRRRLEIPVPENARDGTYQFALTDAAGYARMRLGSRPHLMRTRRVEDLVGLIREVYALENDRLYAMLILPEQEVAVGREEMPGLPSSRKALFANPASTEATPYRRWIERSRPMPSVVSGQVSLPVQVQADPRSKDDS